jgi:hypothetical protein
MQQFFSHGKPCRGVIACTNLKVVKIPLAAGSKERLI